MNQQLFTTTLQKHQLSNTVDRQKLFFLLDDQKDPVSMKELVVLAQVFTNRSTVYRTIDLFEKIGVVNRIYTGWKYRIELSDTFSSHHHHMSCMACGKITAFDELPHFHSDLKELEQTHGFQIQSHSLELKGLCKSCR